MSPFADNARKHYMSRFLDVVPILNTVLVGSLLCMCHCRLHSVGHMASLGRIAHTVATTRGRDLTQ